MGFDFPSSPTVGQTYAPASGILYTWNGYAWAAQTSSAFGVPLTPQGRLTLQSATPVMTTSQTAKTAIFYTPYVGNQIPLYNGTSMVPTTFSELTVATTDTANSPAAIGTSKVNDWFVWDSGGGVLRLVHGPDWTNDTTRSAGTALIMMQGILVNAVAITNGPAIQRGTYVGTTRSNASSQLDWVIPSAAAGGGRGFFGVWNTYNRVMTGGECRETTASWNVPAGIRMKNGSANNSIAFVSGLQEDVATATHHLGLCGNNTSGETGICGIGVDVSNAFTSVAEQGIAVASNQSSIPPVTYVATSLGHHVWNALESMNGANSPVIYSNLAGPPARQASSLIFSFLM